MVDMWKDTEFESCGSSFSVKAKGKDRWLPLTGSQTNHLYADHEGAYPFAATKYRVAREIYEVYGESASRSAGQCCIVSVLLILLLVMCWDSSLFHAFVLSSESFCPFSVQANAGRSMSPRIP